MRRINIREATGDPILVRPLVDERGAFVLAAGKPLTRSLIERLWERGFRHAYIDQPGFEDVPAVEPLPAPLYSRLRRVLGDVVDAVRNTRPGGVPELPTEEMDKVVAEGCDELSALGPGRPFLLYPSWEGPRDSWIAFAANTAVLAGLLGLQLGVQQARRLFMAALVQDVGLWRTSRPQDHVGATQDLLRPVRGLSSVVKAIAAEHHERLDGTGYPHGKTKDALHELSLVMHVAVTYVELISRAADRLLPHEALETLMAGANELYDGPAVHAFRRLVHTYPPGTVVRLNTGQRGVVLEPGPAGLHRPKVRVLPASIGRVGATGADELSEEEALVEYPEIDLGQELSIMIERVLD